MHLLQSLQFLKDLAQYFQDFFPSILPVLSLLPSSINDIQIISLVHPPFPHLTMSTNNQPNVQMITPNTNHLYPQSPIF